MKMSWLQLFQWDLNMSEQESVSHMHSCSAECCKQNIGTKWH